MVNEVKVEHVLILAIAVFLLYHFVGRCNCFNGNGFRVGGQSDRYKKEQETARNILGISGRIQKLETDLKECKSDRYKEEQETARNILGISGRIQKLETELRECRRKQSIIQNRK